MLNFDNHYINHNTKTRTNYYATKNSIILNKIFKYKTFASCKVLKYKNKTALRLYNASNTTKAFWLSIINPILRFFHFCGMYIFQGILYITVIPFLRIKMNCSEWRAVNR